MKYMNRTLIVLMLAMLPFVQACEKQTDPVLAPYGSKVIISEGSTKDFIVTSAAYVWFTEYEISVIGSDGEPMNGIGINLATGTEYAVFANSNSAIDLVKTGDNGFVLVPIYVYGGPYFAQNVGEDTLTVSIFADIVVDSKTTEITLTKAF